MNFPSSAKGSKTLIFQGVFFYAEGFWNRLYVASFHMTGVMGLTFQGQQRSARMWESSPGDTGTLERVRRSDDK